MTNETCNKQDAKAAAVSAEREREREGEKGSCRAREPDSESESAPEPRTELVPTKIYAFCRVYALCETKRQTV